MKPKSRKRVLLIEDHKELAMMVKASLTKENYEVVWVADGEVGEKESLENKYSLILLDVILPHKSGLEILKKIRKKKVLTPVIIVSTRNSIDNLVEGLNQGADDYIYKPFKTEELLARVESLFRRTSGQYSRKVFYKDLTLDLDSEKTFRQNDEIKMTKTMFRILNALVCHIGEVVERHQLIEQVWGEKNVPKSGTIDVHINAIRNALDSDYRDKYIKTVHNTGYYVEK